MKPAGHWLPSVLVTFLVSIPAAPGQEPRKAAPATREPSPARFESVHKLLQAQVSKKEIAGAVVLVMQRGKPLYFQSVGMADVEAGRPMTRDTIFRIASMTKPITSVAVMMLHEQGRFQLSDPIARYLPEFQSPQVIVPAPDASPSKALKTVAAQREISIHDLLTHTSGITYRFSAREPLAPLYQKAGISDGLSQTEGTLADNVRRLARLPLQFEPGSAWEYGLSVDVLGRLVEVVSKKNLDEFFRERIFQPLGMKDTYFFLPPGQRDRLAALYGPGANHDMERVGDEPKRAGQLVYSASYPYRGPKTYFSGGAGLVSTAADYGRFLQMLLNGGEFNGVRLLQRETTELMTRNQIGNLKMPFSEHGDKFGYGFGIVSPEGKAKEIASTGTYSWGGLFHTYFWVDPKKQVIGVLMTQLYPFWQLTTREDFQRLVYEMLPENSP